MSAHQNLIREIKAEQQRRLDANRQWELPPELAARLKTERARVARIAAKALRHVGFSVNTKTDLFDLVRPVTGMYVSLDHALRDQRREASRRKIARRRAIDTSSALRSELYILTGKPIPKPLADRIRRYLRGK